MPEDFENGAAYYVGKNFSFSAEDTDEKVFDHWVKVIGSRVQDIYDKTLKIEVSDQPITLYPIFIGAPCEITLSEDVAAEYETVNGQEETITMNVTSGMSVPKDSVLKLKAFGASDGYAWFVNGEKQDTDGTSFELTVEGNIQIEWKSTVEHPLPEYCKLTLHHEGGEMPTVSVDDLNTIPYDKEITVTAEKADGCNFAGWYDGETLVCPANIYKFNIKKDTELTAKYEDRETVSIRINGGSANYTVNGNEMSTEMTEDYKIGSELTIVACGDKFAYWENSYGMVLSRKPEYIFTVTGAETLIAVYNTSVNGKATLVFESPYGQILARKQLASDGEMAIPNLPYRNGYTAVGWDMNGDGKYDAANDTLAAAITRGLDASNNVAKITPLYQLNDTSYIITVNGGTGSGTYKQNDVVSVTANEAPSGKKFAYWTDASGKEISYNTSFTFFADGDWELTAVFVDEYATVDEKGITSIISKSKDENSNSMIFVSFSTVSEGFKIEKAGIIATGNSLVANSGDGFNAQTAQHVRGDAWNGTSYRYTWTASGVSAGTTIYVRAYLIYTDESGNSHTVYGDVESLTY